MSRFAEGFTCVFVFTLFVQGGSFAWLYQPNRDRSISCMNAARTNLCLSLMVKNKASFGFLRKCPAPCGWLVPLNQPPFQEGQAFVEAGLFGRPSTACLAPGATSGQFTPPGRSGHGFAEECGPVGWKMAQVRLNQRLDFLHKSRGLADLPIV